MFPPLLWERRALSRQLRHFCPEFRTGTEEFSKVGCRRPLKIPLIRLDNCGMGLSIH
jgi:hypothetical protein